MKSMQRVFKLARKLREFLGLEAFSLYVGALVLGVLWFLIETSFIFVIQAFLTSIGLLDPTKSMLPKWIPITGKATAIILIGFGLIRATVWTLRNYFAAATGASFIRHQRSIVLEIGLKYAREITTSEVTMAFNDYITSAAFALQQLSQLINNSVTLLLFVITGFFLAPKEFIISLFLLTIILLPTRLIDRRLNGVGRAVNAEKEDANRTLMEGLQNNFLLQVYHLIESQIIKGKESLRRFESIYNRYAWYASIRSATPQAAGAVVIAFVTWLSLTYFKTPGARLLSFFYIFIRMAQSASDFFTVFAEMKVQIVGLQLLYKWTNSLTSRREPILPITAVSTGDLRLVKIHCKDVGFAYGKTPIIKHINFTAQPGEKILIKGKSGSGKSTLLSLLLGLQKPTEGKIEINEWFPAEIRAALAEHTGYVGPEPFLIPGTVKQNLLYGHPRPDEVTSEDLWTSLGQAQLKYLVQSFRQELDEEIFERAQLSTGQKQRFAIARALLRKPVLLVMDEATANLDPETERSFIELLPIITKKTTAIIVSHKDSFDSIASQIIDLDSTFSDIKR